jgi:fibronectin-binding autotransporter adhesin
MKRIPKLICALIFSVGIAPFVHAQFTWSPSAATGTFETASNWTGGTAPTPGSALTFGSATGITTVSLSSAFSTSSLTFGSTKYELLTSNSSVLSIGSGGVTTTSSSIDLRGPIALTADQTWNTGANLYYSTTNAISGNFGITKTGGAGLTFNAPNTFTGGVTVTSGVIYLDSSSTGTAGAVTSGPIGTGTLTFVGDYLELHTRNSVVIHNAIALGNYTTIIDPGSNSLTLAGVISGPGGTLEQHSSGNLTLSGANTFTGGLTVYDSTSTLTLGSSSTGSAGAIISGPLGTGPLTFYGSSTLTITAGANLTIDNAISPYNEPAGDINIPTASSLTLTGVLDGYVNKTGPGNLILVGANKGADIKAGTLTLGAADIIDDYSTVSVETGATFNLAGFSDTIGSLSGAGNVTLGTGTLTLYGESTSTFSGVISGSGSLVNSGFSFLTLSGANTYTGATTINGGTLAISADTNLGTAPASATSGNLVFNGGYLNTTASFTLAANRGINVAGFGGTIETDPSTTLTYAGIITGTGSLNKEGEGTLILSGASNFSGGFNIYEGSLLLGASSTQTSYYDSEFQKTFYSVTSGPVGTGTLSLYADTTLGVAVGAGPITLHNDVEFTDNYDPIIDTTNGNITLLGTISGEGSLTKIGTGTLTLSGASIFTGGATVSAGTLLLGSSSVVVYQEDPWSITSGPFGTGTLTLAGGTTLAPVAGSGTTTPITIYNPIILSGDATIGTLGSSDQLRIDTEPGLASGIRGSGPGRTLTVAGGLLTLAADPAAGYVSGENYNLDTITVNSGAALVFAFESALPTNAVNVAVGGYVGVANGVLNLVPQGFLSTTSDLIAKLSPSAFAGTFGFDSESPLSPAIYTGTLDFSSFSNANFDGLGTLGYAIIGTGATLFAPSSGPNSGKLAFSALNGGTLQIDAALLTAHNFTNVVIGRNDGRGDKGTVVLSSSSNNYTGGTTLLSGVLAVRDAAALGTGTLTASSASAVPASSANAPKLTTTVAGQSALGLTLANNLVVNTSYASGTYGLGIGGVDDFMLSGAISGSGVIDKYGAGTLTLTGDGSAFTGKTNILAGTLTIGNGGTTGSLAGNIANSAALVINRSDAVTYSGILSGSGSFTKLGTGTLTLSGANTGTGAISLNAGALALGSASALGTTGTISFGGGVLQFSSANTTDYSARFSTAASQQYTIDTNGQTLTFASALTSAGGALNKLGTGTLILTGANTFNSGTTISAGTLRLGATDTLPVTSSVNVPAGATLDVANSQTLVNVYNSAATSAVSIAAGKTLTLTGTGGYAGSVAGSGTLAVTGSQGLSGAIANTAAVAVASGANLTISRNSTTLLTAQPGAIVNSGTLDYQLVTNGYSLNIPSLISGTGDVKFSFPRGYTLTNANTYTGATIIDGGAQLDISATSLSSGTVVTFTGTGSQLHVFGDATIRGLSSASGILGLVTVQGGNTLTLAAPTAGENYVFSPTINGGTVVKNGLGTQSFTGAVNAILNINAGTVSIGDGGTTGSFVGSITNNANLTFNRSDAVTYTGVVSGTGSLSKQGAGSLSLNAQNTYTGSTYLSGGTLTIGVTNALPVTTQLALSSNAILDVLNNQTIAGFLTTDITTSLLLGAGATFTVAMPTADQTTTFAGNVTGAGIFAVSGAGNDVVNLTGAVTNTGGTVVGLGASLVIGSGGSVTGPITTTGTLTFNNPGSQTLSNVISGTGGISVSTGTTILSGNNNYSGPTNINGGKLLITGTNTGGGMITVGSGGTFGGTGSTTGPLVLNSGATVSPGASPGILNVGATTFAGGANFTFEINNAIGTAGNEWDLLRISGALTITATAGNPFTLNLTSLNTNNAPDVLVNFNSANTYDAAGDNNWKFATVDVTGNISGFDATAFQINTSQFQNSIGSGSFFVTSNGSELFLNFTPVPEPSTYALLAVGLGVIAVIARRRRS